MPAQPLTQKKMLAARSRTLVEHKPDAKLAKMPKLFDDFDLRQQGDVIATRLPQADSLFMILDLSY